MDDKQLYEAWRRANCENGNTIDIVEMMRGILSGERKTALMRLAERYQKFYRVSFIAAAASLIFFTNPVFSRVLPVWVLPLWGILYFIMAGIMDITLYNRVKDINVLSMPVSEVIRRATDCRRFHLRCILVLLPIALTFVGIMVWIASDNRYFVYGAAAGFVVGLAIGLNELNKFMRDYRLIMRRDDEEED